MNPAQRYILTAPAQRDLNRLSEYVARNSGEDRADDVETELFSAFAAIARRPAVGHTRRDLTSRPVRFFAVYHWLIMYDPATSPVLIQAILHGARDVRAILSHRRG